MTPEECAEKTTAAVSGIASHFMLDGGTYAAGAQLGFSGLDFYAAGRAGVLERMDPDTVASCFGFFEPSAVETWLEQAEGVMAPAEASAAFMGCAYDWADEHLSDQVAWDRLAALLAKVIAAAPVADLPLSRAWQRAPEPPADRGSRALALHRFHVLREIRNELHVAAVRDAGLGPRDALLVKSPAMAGLFGWGADLPEVDEDQRSRHAAAEADTNRRIGAAYAALDEDEREELVSLCEAALASVH